MRGLDGGLGLDGLASGGSAPGEAPDYDSFASAGISLQEHLLAQAGYSLSDRDLVIAGQVIEQIDETGSFLGSVLDLAQRLGAPLADFARDRKSTRMKSRH